MRSLMLATALTAIIAGGASAQSPATSSGAPVYQTCGDVHQGMCMVYCRDNRANANACIEDCNGRLKTCLGEPGGQPGYAGYYWWGNWNKFKGLRQEVTQAQRETLKK